MTDTDLATQKDLMITLLGKNDRYEAIQAELPLLEGTTVSSVVLQLDPGYNYTSTDSKLLTAAETAKLAYIQALKDEAAAL